MHVQEIGCTEGLVETKGFSRWMHFLFDEETDEEFQTTFDILLEAVVTQKLDKLLP